MEAQIMAAFFCLLVAAVVVLAVERRKWRQDNKMAQKRERSYQKQKEEMEIRIRFLERELEQEKEKNREIKYKLQTEMRLQKEREQELGQREETFRNASLKIHLYIQLLKEQCEGDEAQKQCDIILRECQRAFSK